MSAGANDLPYELHVEGFGERFFRVHSFTGEEALSEAYSFDVITTVEAPGELVEQTALGQRAILIFHVGEQERAFHGVIAGVRLAQAHSAAHALQYHLRLVPRLWLLKRKKRSRIFQKMRVPDIVSAVLQEAGISTRFQLVRAYPMREYCTQYEETDYRFVKRILAEAGIYFYFPTGPAMDFAALTAEAAVGAAAAVGGEVLGAVAGPMGSAAASLVGSAVSAATPLVGGDTVICADDAASYPPVGGDDPAVLAAATAAALAPEAADVLGIGGTAGAVIGAASAVAGTIIADAESALRGAPVHKYRGFEGASVGALDTVTHLTLFNRVKSSAAMFRDYDPERPMVRLQSTAVSTAPFPPGPFDVLDEVASGISTAADVAGSLIPGASDALSQVSDAVNMADSAINMVAGALGQRVPFEVYEHHANYLFPKWAFANDEASLIVRQKRRRASMAEGAGSCPDLSPAHRFALLGHPASQLDQAYVATTVKHRGQTRADGPGEWRVYSNTFECAPAQMTFIPPRPKRKSVQVTLTATVVGPAGQEIYVDAMGQIKVQFHWDREGKFDENSSCWIRTMQPWGGAAWGHQFIPRIGMEVVVVFEGGDPDKPMILGSMYNGTHPFPFTLPQGKTWSGIRTQSTPGGKGHNELSFNDAAANEMVHIHAQRDYEEIIRRNQSSKVEGNRTEHVVGTTTEHVGRNAELDVGHDRTTTVGADDHEFVRGTKRRTADGQDAVTVGGDRKVTVHGTLAVEARKSHSLTVGEPDETTVSDYYVYGTASIGATERVLLRAPKGLLIECGEASIELTPEKIVLHAPSVEIAPSKSLACSAGDGPSMKMGKDGTEILSKKFSLFSESGAMELDKEVKVKGDKIKLGYDPQKPDPDKKDDKKETKPFSCKFSNYFLEPYKNKKYHLMVEGKRLEGQTDGDGTAKQDIPKTANQVVVRLWIDQYPEGRQRLYTLDLADIPPAAQVKGAKQRLKNLGYYDGPVDELADDKLKHAVAEFQDDHRDSHALEPDGELNAGTAGALEEIHGG